MNLVKWGNLDDREIVLEAFNGNHFWIEMKYNKHRIPSPENVLINGTLKINPGSNYLGEEFNIFTKYAFDNNWHFVFLFGVFNPKDVQIINNETPNTSFTISLQTQYRFAFDL